MKKLLLIIFVATFFGCEKSSESMRASGGAGQGGSLARFTVVGNFLYAVDQSNLRVFDVTNSSQPVFVRSIPVGFEIETIYPFSDKLFIGSTSVVHIFSITEPANPQKLSEAISPQVLRRCDPVVAKGNVAYATLRTNGACGGTQSILAVYDITNITQPVQVTSLPLGEPYGLGYSGDALYVCDANSGIVVFNISNVFQPQPVSNFSIPNTRFIDVIPYGDLLICWTTKGMALYDISNKFNPVPIKQIM